jgi:hypothetical protein
MKLLQKIDQPATYAFVGGFCLGLIVYDPWLRSHPSFSAGARALLMFLFSVFVATSRLVAEARRRKEKGEQFEKHGHGWP